MKYKTPELAVAMFDSDIGTESMSQIPGEGNSATQSLEQSSTGGGTDAQIFKFIWE